MGIPAPRGGAGGGLGRRPRGHKASHFRSYDLRVPDIYVTLNARLRPLDRGAHFEDPLIEILEKRKIKAEITGGGTLLGPGREPSNCDIVLEIKGDGPSALHVIIEALEGLGAPVGSKARVADGEAVPFGTAEGLGIYLNGTDLPDEVYSTNDVNELLTKLHERLGPAGRMLSYWEGPTETALYFYGASAQGMRAAMADVLASHPLAHSCRVEKLTPGTSA